MTKVSETKVTVRLDPESRGAGRWLCPCCGWFGWRYRYGLALTDAVAHVERFHPRRAA